MPESIPIVLIVEDDASFRRSIERLLRSAGLTVKAFGSAHEFLRNPRPDGPACLILDVGLPGLGGLDLQRKLAKISYHIPIIFMTGQGDIPMSVQAIKGGAVEFLTKPFHDQDLLNAIQDALLRDQAGRQKREHLAQLRQRYDSLTPREREVMACVIAGMLNKQIAADLGTAEKTIKFHRAHIMQKMIAPSLAELVRMGAILDIHIQPSHIGDGR
jgi:FixJ family two-component response regulator